MLVRCVEKGTGDRPRKAPPETCREEACAGAPSGEAAASAGAEGWAWREERSVGWQEGGNKCICNRMEPGSIFHRESPVWPLAWSWGYGHGSGWALEEFTS